MKRNVALGLLLVPVAAGLVYWFGFHHATASAEEEAKPSAAVELVGLQRQEISQTLEVLGLVASAPSGEQVVAAPYDCVVRQVHVAPGTTVAAGDVLLEIDPSPEAKLQLEAARGASALAGKALAAAQERYDLKLANQQDLLAAQQAAQDARLKSESLEARGLGGAGRVAALAAGVVGKLEASVGTLVPAGTALVSISSNGGLEARLSVEAAEVARVHSDQPVILRSVNRPETEAVRSSVRTVGGALDAVTGSAEVRVPVPLGAPLLVGEHLKATIELQTKQAFVVARTAVLPDEDKQVLYTVKDGKAVRHEVHVGIAAGDRLEVSGADLHEGDPVVTLGNYELTDGLAIQVRGKEVDESEPAPGTKETKP